MKPAKGVPDLAERLRSANATPLVPFPGGEPPAVQPAATPAPAAPVRRPAADRKATGAMPTRQITLRPTVDLWARYINAAAERSKQAGRTVTAQEIALEIMEKAAL